jgi:hypothetical protein
LGASDRGRVHVHLARALFESLNGHPTEATGVQSVLKAAAWTYVAGALAAVAMLLYYLTFKVSLFPAGGYVPLTEDPLRWASHLILPWTALAVLFIGFYSRVLRSNVLDTMNEDYVRTARAKGLGERRVLVRHVLRNSLVPIVTLFGLDFGAVVGGGAILTETVFDLGGVGQYAADAVGQLDLPPLMGVTIFGAFFSSCSTRSSTSPTRGSIRACGWRDAGAARRAGPGRSLRDRGRPFDGGGSGVVRGRSRRGACDRRRVRLWQDGHGAEHDGARGRAELDHGGVDPARRQ